MLNVMRRSAHGFQAETPGAGWRPGEDVVWVDLLEPTREEELAVEAALGLDLPTQKEMEALEPSSRLYQEGGATFMTATLLALTGQPKPHGTPVTFVVARGLLVTLRYDDLRAFTMFADRAAASGTQSGVSAFLGLGDAMVERLAEILGSQAARAEEASAGIFERPQSGNFRPVMTQLAHAQSVTSLARNALVSLSRVFSFAALAPEIAADPECRAHLDSLQRDVSALTEQASYQSSHNAFLLDATLGLVNIEQNGIIKFFSVVAVAFLPPTLVASIYGMNFKVMPELDWAAGYPFALGLMVVSGVLPVLWFKARGWL